MALHTNCLFLVLIDLLCRAAPADDEAAPDDFAAGVNTPVGRSVEGANAAGVNLAARGREMS